MRAAGRRILANGRRRTGRSKRFPARAAEVARLALGALLAVAAGCQAPVPSRPGDNSLTLALESAPIQLDPRVGTDQASSRVYELMSNGLVTKDVDGNFVPDLATSWEVLDDARRYRFHLREGVRFHDGRPFSSADVAWTFGSLLDGSVASAKRGAIPQLERVVAIDPLTVDFVLREPFGALTANLTSYLGIVPAGMTPEEMTAHPVGTGPWRLVERSPSLDRIVFAAFDGYFGGRPKLDRLIVREVPEATVRVLELRKGSVQLTINNIPPDVLPLLERDPSFEVPRKPGANYVYVGLNLTDPALARPAVRRALELALDRPLLVESLWRGLGQVTETILPPGHWARADDLPLVPHDPAEAMRLLDAAGFRDPDGPDGPRPRLTLSYKTSTDETALLQAQILQAMWARVGVAVDLRSYEFATFYNDIKRGNFQMFSLTWTGVADPDIYSLILHSRAVPPAGANRGHYANPEFDALIEAGRRLADPAERRPFYLRAQAILARDLPYLSLFTKVNHAVMPRGLAGYEHYPSGELYSLRQMFWRPAVTPSAGAPRR